MSDEIQKVVQIDDFTKRGTHVFARLKSGDCLFLWAYKETPVRIPAETAREILGEENDPQIQLLLTMEYLQKGK